MPTSRRGSLLLTASMLLFVMLTVAIMAAAAQLSHAERLDAEQARLQALYAAEAGVFAAIDAASSVPSTVLLASGATQVTYQANRPTPDAGGATWIEATGTVNRGGETVRSRLRCYEVGRVAIKWEYLP